MEYQKLSNEFVFFVARNIIKQFINLTPHTLNIIKADGSTIDIQPSGNIARVSSSSTIVATLKGINVSQQTFGDVIDLPDAQDGIIYIVSQMVKDRVPDRPDVLVPGAPVRDSEGRIIGANGLSL
jgi:hypothetical protein